MEEKERYRFFETAIQDTEYQNTDVPQSLMDKTLCCIRLNEQDARIKELEEENQQLKQQLAEKEKEIEQLTEELDYKKFWNDFVDLYTGNKLKTQMLHENWKDKISFAVEQLTLLKNSIVNKMNNPYSVNIKHILSDFDNQIKQLKVKAERS